MQVILKLFFQKVLTLNFKCAIVNTGGEQMSDVRQVFITREVANKLNITTPYLIRIAKSMNLSDEEFREAGKRNYLFNNTALDKLKQRFNSNK